MLNIVFSILLSVMVSASIDSTTIFIGDQTDLHLQATCSADEKVAFPIYGQTLIPGIEIVDQTIVDTTTLKDGRVQFNQYLTLTSFHDSLFYIAPIPFLSGEDTLFSEAMNLNVVQPFEMDSNDISITDIKPIQKAPIWWWGIIRIVLLIILLAGIGIGIYYLIRRFASQSKDQTEAVPEELLRPAEEVALEKLDLIREQKIWQSGQVKEYHTQLTDVVREYISRRYDVQSTEKTSYETLRELKPLLQDRRELFEQLSAMLSLADLVKFAKWSATPEENEKGLRTAYDFVHLTTPVPQESESQQNNPNNPI